MPVSDEREGNECNECKSISSYFLVRKSNQQGSEYFTASFVSFVSFVISPSYLHLPRYCM